MSSKRGFTLIEALIATGCLVVGVVGVSHMFAYSARTNMYTEQLTTGILLANAKAEELGVRSVPNLPSGGGLDATSPTQNYFDYVDVAADGSVTSSTSDTSLPYVRMWQISGTNPRLITVAVVARRSGASGRMVELIRTTTQVTN
jgi:Tfp pilus assembly protein PilV